MFPIISRVMRLRITDFIWISFDAKLRNVFFCVLLAYSISYFPSTSIPVNKSLDQTNRSKVPGILGNLIDNVNTGENTLSKLNYDAIKPPDHLKGLKMERDGHLNKNFRKEILLGNDVNQVDKDENLLTEIFNKLKGSENLCNPGVHQLGYRAGKENLQLEISHLATKKKKKQGAKKGRADVDQNHLLSQEELEAWIDKKVKEHFSKAARENFFIFSTLDKDHNGRVSWEEYHTNFMIEQGFNKSYAQKHPENHKRLQRKIKEKILLDKAAWSEAANSDFDALNIDEFLTFRHPEHSHVSLLNMVNDIIVSLDTDGDGVLTEQEFGEMPDHEETNRTLAEWKQERIKEFHESIDLNHDGKVNRQELLMYNDPENRVHSKQEAKKLIALADLNKDGYISLKEVLSKKDVFLGSKMVDSARSFHDEF